MSLPVWQAAHAYVVGTRVTPTTPNGTVWQVAMAGTSAGVEPTWPTAEPWTVTDGTVAWGRAGAFRSNAVAGLLTTLRAFRTANPTLLRGIASAQPKAYANLSLPGAYVDGRAETLTFAHNIRTRVLAGLSVVVVDAVPDNEEGEARMDALVDGLLDAFAAAVHSADGFSITLPSSVTEEALTDDGGGTYLGNRITFGPTQIAEGWR